MKTRVMSNSLVLQWLQIFISMYIPACTVGPDYHRPETPVPAPFKELDGWKEARPRDHEIPGKWWEIFKDPYLNTLEEQVDIANQSLAQAEAQYRQAQALVQTARAAYFPTASVTASTNRFRAASGQNVAARETVRLTINQYKAGTVSYLNVMTAQGVALTNEKLAVDLLGQRLSAAVLLVKAVDGGWNAAALPNQDKVGGETKWSQFLPIPVE